MVIFTATKINITKTLELMIFFLFKLFKHILEKEKVTDVRERIIIFVSMYLFF